MRDRREIIRVPLIKMCLHLHDEHRRERQNREQRVEDHHIIARRVEEGIVNQHAPRPLPDDDVRQEEPERVAERSDEEPPVPSEIREKGKQHPVLRQTEAACHIEEKKQDEHTHPHIHRQQRRCSGRQECRLQKGKRQCKADENTRDIAEDQILELLDRREVDAADPDKEQRGKEEMR